MMLALPMFAYLSLLTGSWARREVASLRHGAVLSTLERRTRYCGRKGRSARRVIARIDELARYVDRLGRRPRWWRYEREHVSLRLTPDEEVGGLAPFGWTWTDKFFSDTSPLVTEAGFSKMFAVPWFWTLLGVKRPEWYAVETWRRVV